MIIFMSTSHKVRGGSRRKGWGRRVQLRVWKERRGTVLRMLRFEHMPVPDEGWNEQGVLDFGSKSESELEPDSHGI